MTDEILFDDEELEAASHWYSGQGSMLYAVTSTGSLRRGTIRPRHPEGGPMTDEEWMIDLAERLEGEAERAASDAAKQAKKAKGVEKKELIADREGLRSIAFKASQFVHDAQRASRSKAHHSTKSRSYATKKTSAQLDREIAAALSRTFRTLVKMAPSDVGGRVHYTLTEKIIPKKGGVEVETHKEGSVEGARVDLRWRKFYPGVSLEAAAAYRLRHGYHEIG